MNFEQVKGIVERVAMFAVAYFVGKGWIPEAVSGDIVAGIGLLFAIVWGFKVNTPKALEKAASDVQG